jgi:predicted RNase H-related nuclease YkuK (DUF458 family)
MGGKFYSPYNVYYVIMEILKEWRSLSDRRVVEPASYLADWISKNPDCKIYIGCDSSNLRDKTTFATVIVLHKERMGGHVIYSRESEPRIRSRHERLWKEVELSVSAAHLLDSWGFGKPDSIDIDLNPDPRYQSNMLLSSAVGMVESMGIKARWKSKSPWAISIADSICR